MSSAHNSRDEDGDIRQQDERRHRVDKRRSRSRSHSRRHRDDSRSRSRSRSHSVERYRRRHARRSRSRSHSRSHGYSSRRKSSRRYGDSRSRSRSRSSHRSNKYSRSRRSTSRSPRRSHKRYESRKSNSRSSERYQTKKQTCDDKTHSNSESRKSIDEDNNSSQFLGCATDAETLENLPLPEQTNSNSYEYLDDSQDPIDKERIHREIEEKLRQALAKEGKIYPPPKPEASHPVFANDGSFLEIFKKMQEAQQQTMTAISTTVPSYGVTTPSTSAAAYTVPILPVKTVQPPPLVGRRRGGKILKTGVVAKPKAVNNGGDDKDFWSLYLAEVNKYKNNACELNSGNRPLLK